MKTEITHREDWDGFDIRVSGLSTKAAHEVMKLLASMLLFGSDSNDTAVAVADPDLPVSVEAAQKVLNQILNGASTRKIDGNSPFPGTTLSNDISFVRQITNATFMQAFQFLERHFSYPTGTTRIRHGSGETFEATTKAASTPTPRTC